MRLSALPLTLLAAAALAGCGPREGRPQGGLAWAYPRAPAAPIPPPPPGVSHVPGSALAMTQAQITDELNPPDWFPNEHPPAPPSVAHGHKGGALPCAECHLANGEGFLGVPDLAGLPAGYIVEQVHEFRNGRRRSAEPNRPATQEMIDVADKVTEPELASAATYFASLPRRPWFRVVEAGQVPATRPDYNGWLDLVPGKPAEPANGRIIEVPEDPARAFVGDPHSGRIVYAPVGAVARGEAVARSGGAAGVSCDSCHGADLRGNGSTPPLTGRSAAYLARMLGDIRAGTRTGPPVVPMKIVAQGLTNEDITNVAAYLASRKP